MDQYSDNGFVWTKVEGIHFYTCCAPPSLSIEVFTDFFDKLVDDMTSHFHVTIAGDFKPELLIGVAKLLMKEDTHSWRPGFIGHSLVK